uniref:Ovule protein n=1 Tax=Caenorhabditis tropicalis TaxID=1561998 RepID=A0A1I7TEE1_9PELO
MFLGRKKSPKTIPLDTRFFSLQQTDNSLGNYRRHSEKHFNNYNIVCCLLSIRSLLDNKSLGDTVLYPSNRRAHSESRLINTQTLVVSQRSSR